MISPHCNLRLLGFQPELTVLPRLEYSGTISAQCNLRLLGSNDSTASASRVAGITDTCCQAQLIFVFLVETGCHLISNSWPQVIYPPWPPKVLVLQVLANAPGETFLNYILNAVIVTDSAENNMETSVLPVPNWCFVSVSSTNHILSISWGPGYWPSIESILMMTAILTLAPHGYSILQSLTLSPRLECTGVILTHCTLRFQGSNTGFCHVGKAGLELLTSLASQSAGITVVEPLLPVPFSFFSIP
ncbi:Zinc finger protein, partial [Plecturocebus cupreus]